MNGPTDGIETLSGTLFVPMRGQTDMAWSMTGAFGGGGYDGWCGSAFCDVPITFAATKIAAPELNVEGAAACMEMLLASLLVVGGRRAAMSGERNA